MKTIERDLQLVARCGLYCGACPRYLNDKCSGCEKNDKAKWCKLRACCIEKKIASCADCNEFESVMDCKKFNTFMARIFGFIFNTDRAACIAAIKTHGYETFMEQMVDQKTISIKRD